LAFFAQTTASFCKNLIITLVFEKNANIFRRKLAKIAENCDHSIDSWSTFKKLGFDVRSEHWYMSHQALWYTNMCRYILIILFLKKHSQIRLPGAILQNLELQRQCSSRLQCFQNIYFKTHYTTYSWRFKFLQCWRCNSW
jgi:hypothetical protein